MIFVKQWSRIRALVSLPVDAAEDAGGRYRCAARLPQTRGVMAMDIYTFH